MYSFVKNISLYSIGDLLNKSIQFLLLPVYAHYLSPEDYGKLELTYLYAAILVIFYGLIIENGYSRIFFDRKELVFRNTLFGTAFIFKLITGFTFLSFSILLSDNIANIIFNFANGSVFIKLISISVFLKSLAEVPLKTLIIEKRAKRFVINNLLYVLTSLSSTVYFVVVLNLNIKGVLYGQILGAFVQIITLLFSEWKWSYLNFSFTYLKEMLYFSIFLIPSQLASFVTYWSNRLFLQEYSDLNEVGKFSFGYKIASIIPILLTGPLKKAISPEIYELIENPVKCKESLRKYVIFVLIFLCLFALILSIFSKELIMLMASKEYITSYKVVFILSLGYVLIGLAGIVVLPINISKRTWLITITWILSSCINVALNYYLVSHLGIIGASLATLFTFLFILILYFIFAELVFKVSYNYTKYSIILLLTIIAYTCSIFVHTKTIYFDIIAKSFIILIYCFVIFQFAFSKEDRKQIIFFISSKLK